MINQQRIIYSFIFNCYCIEWLIKLIIIPSLTQVVISRIRSPLCQVSIRICYDQNWNSNFDWTKLEYGFDELENLESSNNKKTREVTDHDEGEGVRM
jgi:hypothetical protein